jgi:hypothetical protein
MPSSVVDESMSTDRARADRTFMDLAVPLLLEPARRPGKDGPSWLTCRGASVIRRCPDSASEQALMVDNDRRRSTARETIAGGPG